MADLKHEQAPRPQGKVVDFDKIATLDQAIDYLLAGFHACVDQAAKHADKRSLWETAGNTYLAAQLQIAGIKGLPGDHLDKARDLVIEANKAADKAASKNVG